MKIWNQLEWKENKVKKGAILLSLTAIITSGEINNI